MTDSLLFAPIVITAIFGVIFLFYSRGFRMLIKSNAFNGMDPNRTRQLISTQKLFSKVLMTYIWKCNPTGKQRLGFAAWFLVCHYIHAIAYGMIVAMSWSEIIPYILFEQSISADVYVVGTLTYNHLIDLTTYTILAALPVSALLAFPFSVFSKKKSVGREH